MGQEDKQIARVVYLYPDASKKSKVIAVGHENRATVAKAAAKERGRETTTKHSEL